jgi:hypothetical protein
MRVPFRQYLGALLIAAALPAMAEEGRAPAPGPTVVKPRLSPLAADMMKVIESEQQALAALSLRFKRAGDARAALAVQREIERVKLETEVSLLRIQASYARREGRLKTAQEIEAAVETMLRVQGLQPVPKSQARGGPQRER